MSGGSFNYAYSRVHEFAGELGNRLDQPDKLDEWGQKPNSFPPEVLEKLAEIQAIAEQTAELMKQVEWLYSGDTGSDTFLCQVAEIEARGGR